MNTTTLSPPAPRTLVDLLPRSSTRSQQLAIDVALIAGFAVFTALLAQARINTGFSPVPITGQTLGALLAGTGLGWKRGALSQLLYWAIGIMMPVAWYANDASGASIGAGWKIASGATAGYLFGFVVAAGVVGMFAERRQDRSLATSIPAMLTGTAVIYVFGVGWLAHSLGIPVATGETSAISLGLTPFLVGDAIKLMIAGAITPLAWRFARRS